MLEIKLFEYILAMQTTKYLLGEQQFNLQSHQPSQNDHDIKLDQKVSELLHYLINTPEEVVTRDQLLDDLYSNQLIVKAKPLFSANKKKSKFAVLPFDYYSSNGDREYIANGLTEKIGEVGEQFNVDQLLEGSVQIERQQILVTAQLINDHNDTHVWFETPPKELTDLVAIQNDISEQIAQSLTNKVLI